ncbi:MAG: ribosome silencing factor [Treponema sp.]|jgi:ribosome-associated protein|nr:ribosome silencing factor [Treponema sp.]
MSAPSNYGRDNPAGLAQALGELLEDHKGSDVAVLDLRDLGSWTDFFVIATVSSRAHMEGLLRHLKDFAREQEVEILRRHRRIPPEEEWVLLDLGRVVVHLMTGKARSFYELERLWGVGGR